MDIKGISLFLIPTFVVGYTLAIGGFSLGVLTFEIPSILHFLLMIVLMNLPGLFAFLAGQFSARGPVLIDVFPLPRVAIVRAALVVVVAFVAYNLVAAAFGFTVVDWRLGTLLNKLQEGNAPLSPEAIAVLPAFLLVGSTVATILLGATLIAAGILGHVYAWHAFLQDRLAPLGRVKAAILGGVLWALWFAPFAYYHILVTGRLQQEGGLGKVIHIPIGGVIVAIALTLILRTAVVRSQGLALPAVILGSFIAHNLTGGVTAIWGSLFQIESPPWTGTFGVFGVLTWVLLAAFPGLLAGSAGRESAAAAEASHAKA